MNITYFISSGCSLSWGEELVNRDNRYSNQVANFFKAEHIDISKRGNCNENICKYAIDVCNDLIINQHVNPQNIFLLMNWTFAERLNYFDSKLKILSVIKKSLFIPQSINDSSNFAYKMIKEYGFGLDASVLKRFYDDHNDEIFLRYNFINTIYYAQLFTKLKNIKCVNTFSCHSTNHYLNKTKRKVNLDKSFWISNCNNLIDDLDFSNHFDLFFMDYVRSNNLPTGKTSHPLDVAHLKYSSEIIKFIQNLYGDKISC